MRWRRAPVRIRVILPARRAGVGGENGATAKVEGCAGIPSACPESTLEALNQFYDAFTCSSLGSPLQLDTDKLEAMEHCIESNVIKAPNFRPRHCESWTIIFSSRLKGLQRLSDTQHNIQIDTYTN